MGNAYRIRVGGHLVDRWSNWFEGLAIQRHPDGATTLTGQVVDQAALHGVIARIRDLALPLLSITQFDPHEVDAPRPSGEEGVPPLVMTKCSTLTNRRAPHDGKEME